MKNFRNNSRNPYTFLLLISAMCTVAACANGIAPASKNEINDETLSDSDTNTNTGTWQEVARMKFARSEMPAVLMNGKIYVPGGFPQTEEIPVSTASFEVFDPELNSWQLLADMPGIRHHQLAASYNGFLYVFGGVDASWKLTNTTWKYDPIEDAWTELADMTIEIGAGVAVTLGDYIYVLGGLPGGNTVMRYHPVTDTWVQMAAMQQKREHFAAVTLAGKIYVLAGRWKENNTASAEVYNPETDTWTYLAAMQTARGGLAAAVLDGKILALGGEVLTRGITLDSIEIYDPTKNTWAEFSRLPLPLHGVPAISLYGKIYVIGGSDKAGAISNSGQTFVYIP